jgi:Zn-dependent protease with chaperone function
MSLAQQFRGLFYAGHEKSSVHFTISAHGVVEFEDNSGSKVDISLLNTKLDLIGDPETTLQISWSDYSKKNCLLLCHDSSLFDRLLTINHLPEMQEHLHALQKKQQQKFTSEKYRVPLYMTYITAFFFSTYFMYSFAVPIVTNLIPYEWEKKIGSFAFENFQTGKTVVENSEVNAAMDAIIKRIDEFDDSEIVYEVIVIDAEMVNAFALPGGYVVVTSGLISNSDKPEEVAGVLSHELTHVLERHGMRKLVRQAGLGILIGIVFGDVSALSQLIELSSQLDGLSFDRSQERDADDGGIKIMQAAGISPRHLSSFFKKIRELDSASGDIPEIFRTHPLTDDRIERVSAADEPEQIFEFDLDWQKVKQGVE